MCFSWKSKEQQTLNDIKGSVTDILRLMTKVNHSNDSEMGFYMTMLRNTINQIQKEEDKVKEKDAKFFDKHVCSHCESNKIYICEPCMNDMAKQYDNYSN
tara:strand:+ start:11325 stop:11624 length:300 start_codon:yes stop_codon:yes gene_type:complete